MMNRKIKTERKRESRQWKVKFESWTNDLYWKLCFFDDELYKKTGDFVWFDFEWTGYDDDYWWNKVSPTKTRQTAIGKIDGKETDHKLTLEIDFYKCIAKEVLED